MSIVDKIKQELPKALKSKDEVRISTLRLLSSSLHNEEIAKQKPLSKEDEIAVVKREAKARTEAIEAYKKVGRPDRAKIEGEELAILKEFLPRQMEDSEIEKIVDAVLAGGNRDFGFIMGQVMGKVRGQADGTKVSEIVRQKLVA